MILLKNALIYDGTGSEPFKGDILIENDKIVKVEDAIQAEDGWEVVDLEGLSVSSGFIDAHSHNDWFAIKKEPKKYFEPFIRQGKKHLTNMRASGSDEALRLEPPRIMSLEKCIEFISDDELVEITPKSIRLRKQVLDTEQRAKMRAKAKV